MSQSHPAVKTLDHLDVNVAGIGNTTAIYEAAMGMNAKEFSTANGEKRWTLYFRT